MRIYSFFQLTQSVKQPINKQALLCPEALPKGLLLRQPATLRSPAESPGPQHNVRKKSHSTLS